MEAENLNTFSRSETLDRLPKQFFSNLTNKAQKVVNEGHDVINLGRGNQDTPTPPRIIKALQQAAENPINYKYAPFRGFYYLKYEVTTFYQKEFVININNDNEYQVLF